MFFLGLLTRRGNSPGAAIGAICGFICTVGAPLLNWLLKSSIAASALFPIFIQAKIHALSGISNFFYAAISTLSTFVAGYVVSFFFAPPLPKNLAGLTHIPDRSVTLSRAKESS
jgi:Na+/proline symporter